MMKQAEFQATVRIEPTAAIIDLSGEINSFADEALNKAYEDAESHDPHASVLNFNSVDYINSTGIALIVGLLARARQSHRPLLTFGLSEHYQEIFRITRLSDFMTIHSDEASALAAAA
jgi:anti-anti-sigma factor